MKGVTHFLALIDAFSQTVQFRTSRSAGSLKSVIGALFTIATISLTLPYLVDRWTILREYGDQSVDSEITLNKYSNQPIELVVGEAPNEQGYSFRFAITAFDFLT